MSEKRNQRNKNAGKRKREAPKKNPIKRRLEVLEKIQSDGIDMLIGEIQRIDRNVRIIADGMDDLDVNVATLRALISEKDLAKVEEFLSKKEEILAIKREAIEKARANAKKAHDEAVALQKEQRENPGVDPELLDMKKKAEEAGEESEHPDGAFIFGGS